MVPFVKSIVSSSLPMLGMCKQDNMRWVFSFCKVFVHTTSFSCCYNIFSVAALAKFCEAIIYYIANIDKAPDPSVTKAAFATEFDAAFEILFNVWISTKEPKVKFPHTNQYSVSLMTSYCCFVVVVVAS